MIKANELRIGNWVAKGGELFKLTSVGEANMAFSRSDFGTIYGHKLEECTPIPITPEILENAFFIDGEKEFQGRIMSVLEGKMLLVTEEDKATLFEFPCAYVHQLQNLHFALTGEELEVKF